MKKNKLTKGKILIVEDQGVISLDIQNLVAKLGYSVSGVATSGKEALEIAKKTKPDLVLMDIVLKGNMDGIETARKIHSLFGIPSIFLTAYIDEERIAKAKFAQPFGYILKPFQKEELKVALEMAVFRLSLEREIAKKDVERRQIDDALRASEAKYKTVIENVTDFVFSIDRFGRFTFVTPNVSQFGYSTSEILGQPFTKIIFRDDLKQIAAAFKKRLATGVGTSHEFRILKKDGSFVWVEEVSKAFKKNGKFFWLVGSARDITERRKTELLKDQFLNTTAHELKTPLIPIRSQCQLLLGGDYGPLNESQKEAIEMIYRREGRLERLVTDIFDLSMARSNTMKFIFEKADLGELIRDSVNNFAVLAKQGGITLSLKTTSKLPPISIDPKRIAQTLENLLSNAIKNTPHTGSVFVAVSKNRNGIRVSVRDTGVGIIKKVLNQLFTPFYQADKTAARKYGGVGLGLAICKEIVEAHGGKIWGESRGTGKGSTFTFTLPLKKNKT